MKNLKINVRMLLSYGIIILLLIITVVFSLWELREVGNDLDTFYENNFGVTT